MVIYYTDDAKNLVFKLTPHSSSFMKEFGEGGVARVVVDVVSSPSISIIS